MEGFDVTITELKVLKNNDLVIKTSEGVFTLSPLEIESVTEKDGIVKAKYGENIYYTITPDSLIEEVEWEPEVIDITNQLTYGDEDDYETIKQWFIHQYQRRTSRQELGRAFVKMALPPGISQKVGKFLGGVEGFLKRFIKGKVTEDEVVERGGESMDFTNPGTVAEFLPRTSRPELEEALAFAKKMDYGDIGDKIQTEITKRDRSALGVVGSQIKKLPTDVLGKIKSNLGGKKRKTRKNRKTLRKRTRKI
jgi:hypothetical protein